MTSSGGPRRRYPGAPPFGDDELSRRMFFGRSREAKELHDLVMAKRLVVLYAKSGMGKSSLINAGLKDALWQDGLIPLPVRVNDRATGPFKTLYEGIAEAAKAKDPEVEYIPGKGPTLWHFFKTAEFWRSNLLLTPLLILDQFEELFTLQSPEEREPFIAQLTDLLRGIRPAAETGDDLRHLTHAPPSIRVLVALREDYLGHLEELAAAIPDILDTRFRLGPLFEPEARQAVKEPADLDAPGLESKPFTYSREALDGIWTFLSRRLPGQVTEGRPHVEPFQLQLVFQRAEEIALENQSRQDGDPVKITWDALGRERGLQATLKSFYERQVAALLSQRTQRAARRLCEYGLISGTGRRLSLEQGEIRRAYKVEKEALDRLVELRLLRHDARVGSWYYELSHDTLVEPILAARQRRERRRRWFGTTLAVALLLGVLGPVAVSWHTYDTLRRAVAQDLTWAPIPALSVGQLMLGCVSEIDRQCSNNEEPRYAAPISRPYELMSREVTVVQFRRFNVATGAPVVRWLKPWDAFEDSQPFWNADDHPAVSISWFEATAFCAFVGGRLPTEAEWEYAARGGHAEWIYPWGNEYSSDQANGAGVGGKDKWEWSAPVGSFLENGFGLYDMAGNVWQWTSSVYRDYPYRGEQPGDPESREGRVVRGGSWGDPGGLRVSSRYFGTPTNRVNDLGFRCARDVSP